MKHWMRNIFWLVVLISLLTFPYDISGKPKVKPKPGTLSSPARTPVTLTISRLSVTLAPGQTIQLTASLKGSTAYPVTWLGPMNPNPCATVSKGLVTAVNPGTCGVVAMVPDGFTGQLVMSRIVVVVVE